MKYIPQAAPFEMIDELITCSEQETRTSFQVREAQLFVEEGCFTAPGLIENMAQTAAAGTGKRAADTGNPPPLGFIGQIKDLRIFRLPPVGSRIETTMTAVMQIGSIFVVKGSVQGPEGPVAEAEFKIFLRE